MKLRKQLLLGYALIFALIIIIAAVSYYDSFMLVNSSKWVSHTFEVIGQARRVEKLMVDMETGIRGYVITGDEAFLEPYNNAVAEKEKTIDQLKALVSDNPPQVEQLKKINDACLTWQKTLAEPEIEMLRKQGRGELTASKTSLFVKKSVGKQDMDSIRFEINKFIAAEHDLLLIREKDTQTRATWNQLVIIFGNLAAIILGIMAAFFISRTILRQVGGEPAEIAVLAGEIAAGNLDVEPSDGKKQPTGILASITDMAKKLQLQFKSRELLSRELETIIDNIPGLVFYKDAENRYLRVNRYVADAHKMKKEYLEGSSLYDLYPADQARAYHDGDLAVIKSGKPRLNIDEPWETETGRFWVSTSKIPCVDEQGKITGVICVSMDVTERRKAEEALDETRHYLENLFDYANAPIIVWSPDHKITRFNHAFEKMTHYKAEEIIGKKLEILFPAESKAESLQKIERTSTGEYWDTVEIPIRQKDGEIKIALWNSANIYDRDGKSIISTIAQGQDITGRKQAEDDLKKRTAQLEEANWDLESFSYSVSHDLQTPLRTINGFTAMILKKQGEAFDEDTRSKFNVIRENTQKMGQLIEDLLNLSRTGRRAIDFVKLDMADLVRAVWKEVHHRDQERVMTLNIRDMPAASGDRTFIREVYVNLIGNAVKFTKHCAAAQIEAGGYLDGNENVYYIRDNGAGFDMAYYDKLFCAFQRLHGPEEYAGTGIGLSIVRRIIHKHGGRVWAEGKEGVGATFYFTLPQI